MISYEMLLEESDRLVGCDRAEVLHMIDFCIKQICKDKKHSITEEIVHNLTFEEVLGALISAKFRFEREKESEE